MTDQELLEAMRQIIQSEVSGVFDRRLPEELERQEQRMMSRVNGELERQEKRLLSGVKVLLENEVQSQINLLQDEVQLIRQRQLDPQNMEELDAQVAVLTAAVKQHSEDIAALKKAQ